MSEEKFGYIFQVDDKPVITLLLVQHGIYFSRLDFSIFKYDEKSKLEKYIPYCTRYRAITIT